MAVLGKRKASSRSAAASDEPLSAEEIFRKHFESQFAPLEDDPAAKRRAIAEDEEAQSDDDGDVDGEDESEDNEEEEGEDEWDGLSDDEVSDEDEDGVVEVIDHSSSQPKTESMSKSELKAFMSSRPPSQTSKPKPAAEAPATQDASSLPEDAPSLLKQDLELRRLLSESHLLSSPSLSAGKPAPAFASGRTKLKATDLRIQALGSKESILKQDKMPMNMRKGITRHREEREAKRRREAKENGIILERPEVKKKKGGGGGGKRDGGVDRPGIGRMRGAELRISEADVRKIEGSRDAFGRRGGSSRGGRGGRGGKRR